MIRRAVRRSDAIICNSSEMARFATEYYRAPRERVRVVYNGVDTARFAEFRKGTRAHGPVIGTVGRLERQKNLDVFLEAAECFRRSEPAARFEIVGEGSERPRLERRVGELGLADSVSFKGTTDDVPGFFSRLDQFWLTSDWEGTPNVVLEAMAAGVPVVATRVGGTPELVEDGCTGVLVPPSDATAVCCAAIALAADPERAARIGGAARNTVLENFSLQRMAERTASVYRFVLESRL
jgi:glycosyltransferase involved in cell wall biosynthesis